MSQDKYLKEGVSLEDAFNYLLGEHLATRAHLDAQKTIITFAFSVMQHQFSVPMNEILKNYPDLVRANYDALVESHPLLQGTWKEYLKENLLDIPGIDLPE